MAKLLDLYKSRTLVILMVMEVVKGNMAASVIIGPVSECQTLRAMVKLAKSRVAVGATRRIGIPKDITL